MTKRRFLQGHAAAVPGGTRYGAKQDVIVVAPNTLVLDLKIRFSALAKELSDSKNAKLRTNLEAWFDSDGA